LPMFAGQFGRHAGLPESAGVLIRRGSIQRALLGPACALASGGFDDFHFSVFRGANSGASSAP
jgi:hypothetical protein